MLREMVADDLTARAISRKIGRSVNAVVGRCLRLSLKLGENRPSEKMRRNHPPKKSAPEPEPKPLPKVRQTTFECRAVCLVDLKLNECRWPINDVPTIGDTTRLDGEYLFCGNPTEPGKSYCCEHAGWSKGQGTAQERAALRGIKE
jgi:GcrA cell cycle regulator